MHDFTCFPFLFFHDQPVLFHVVWFKKHGSNWLQGKVSFKSVQASSFSLCSLALWPLSDSRISSPRMENNERIKDHENIQMVHFLNRHLARNKNMCFSKHVSENGRNNRRRQGRSSAAGSTSQHSLRARFWAETSQKDQSRWALLIYEQKFIGSGQILWL